MWSVLWMISWQYMISMFIPQHWYHNSNSVLIMVSINNIDIITVIVCWLSYQYWTITILNQSDNIFEYTIDNNNTKFVVNI